MSILAYKLLGGRQGLVPAVQGSWRRIAVPLISPSQAWEATAVQEPTVHYDPGTGIWHMTYTGNFSAGEVGYASCSSDPTVPGNWVKYASNPIVATPAFGNSFWVEPTTGTIYLYYYDALGGGNVKLRTSSDWVTWSAATTVFSTATFNPPNVGGWASDLQVWGDSVNGYHMLITFSLQGGGGPPWAVAYATSPDLVTWTVGYEVTTLNVPEGLGGSPCIAEIDGVVTLSISGRDVIWFHNQYQSGSVYVSNIRHARSVDATTDAWSVSASSDLVANRGTYEAQQAADPSVLQVAGKSYLFYSGVNNVAPLSYINLATYPGTLAQLLASIG